MILSDISVKRPVFATVVSLLLITFGVAAFFMLPLRELPDITSPKVSVVTTYDGAVASVVETKITNIIEENLSGIESIKFIDSNTSNGMSRISVEFMPDRDMESAANDVREAVSRITRSLPDEADDPVIWKNDGSGEAVLYVNLQSDTLSPLALNDYVERTIKDRLSLVDGVSSVDVMGMQEYVMRIELDPIAMAARDITVSDVRSVLEENNLELSAGDIENTERNLQVRVERDYNQPDDFRRLMIRKTKKRSVYLDDIATINTGAREIKSLFKANGQNTVGLAIVPMSGANPLDVIARVKADVEAFRPFLPKGTTMGWSYDLSVFINSAIWEVYATLAITIALVVLVIYLFLGNFRATLIPAVTVPVSLLSAFIAIHLFGYTINLITLLALILAIGLVVDDAIVVLENIYSHIERGEPPLVAAYLGAKEVGFAVIATTLVLVMTLVPIAFMGGTVGRLFSEYALTLASAVCFSSLIALTLSPMLSSKLLRKHRSSGISQHLDTLFNKLETVYRFVLKASLQKKLISVLLLTGAVVLIAVIYPIVPKSFVPKEDNGSVMLIVRGAEGASYDVMEKSMTEIERRLTPEIGQGTIDNIIMLTPGFSSMGTNSGLMIVSLEDWKKRNESAFALISRLRAMMADIPDVSVFPVIRSSIGGRSQAPVQFVIGGASYEKVSEWSAIMRNKARQNPGLTDIDLDYRETQPQLSVSINKQRAYELGITAQNIGDTLEVMLGGKAVTTFIERGEEYDVFLTSKEESVISPEDFSRLYIRSLDSGRLIRLDNLVSVKEVGKAARLPHYNRNRSITLSASLVGDYALSEALDYLDSVAQEDLPADAMIDYKGESLDYRSNQRSIMIIFSLALIIVYLVLAAQFESFVHPFVVMLTVPLGLAGGLVGLLVAGETLNIYSQLAMIMLIGLVTKNGILIVEFCNQLRDKGMAFEQAVIDSAVMRLRPVMMTALTTVIGALPLLMASGAGSESRVNIGVVVFSGVSVASVLTLFVVPSLYSLLAKHTTSPLIISRKLDDQLGNMHIK